MKKIKLLAFIFVLCLGLLPAAATDFVDLTVTVVGHVFTLELQDGNQFPLAGEVNLGKLEPGNSDYPVNGVIVAGCKSNTGQQWSLQAESTDLLDPSTGYKLPAGAVKVRGLDSLRSPGGVKLPGTLSTVGQALMQKPAVVYLSNNTGDLGFNNSAGTYVAMGFGVEVPAAQAPGTYTGRVLLTLTE